MNEPKAIAQSDCPKRLNETPDTFSCIPNSNGSQKPMDKQLDLYIDRLPKLPREHQYKCIFNRSEQTTASQTAFGLSCPLPKLMDRQRHIQIEPGRGK